MAVWQKVITSGSSAVLNQLQVNPTNTAGTLQQIGNTATTTFLSGSFSGSHFGSFSGTTATTLNNALTFGLGLSGSLGTSSYNNSGPVSLHISGANTLSNNTHTKWINGAFYNSHISETSASVTIATGSVISTGGLTVTGNSTFNNDLSVLGNLLVAGTASFQNADNLNVRDKFILLNSGSNTFGDSGIVAQSGSASGSALFNKNAGGLFGQYGRWAVAFDVVGSGSATITADEFVVTAKVNQGSAPAPAAANTWGGSASNNNGQGNMWLTSGGDIYIYA
jgi:hypothetical protein